MLGTIFVATDQSSTNRSTEPIYTVGSKRLLYKNAKDTETVSSFYTVVIQRDVTSLFVAFTYRTSCSVHFLITIVLKNSKQKQLFMVSCVKKINIGQNIIAMLSLVLLVLRLNFVSQSFSPH